MNGARTRLLINFRQSVDYVAQLLGGRPPSPGFAFDVSALPSSGAQRAPSTYGSVREMIDDLSIVFGVPKYRTGKPKKVTRKFAHTRLLEPIENLVTCPTCSTIHPSDTICNECYKKVHELTSEIKRKMMEYNPYVGEKQDKEVFVKFKGDAHVSPDVVRGKRVLEMEKERPTWFKKLTLKN
uniref:Large ribosomal subunit protein bL32m n=1 Tax=Caenorhabditis japonica TaxID=281687 RepID=A0A8R1HUA0_CAEJA